jgi:hypothetical protein
MQTTKKTVLEKAAYWLGVVAFGLIIGMSLQTVRAYVGPTLPPTTVNVGAPLNTSLVSQIKGGALGVNGLFSAYAGANFNNSYGQIYYQPGEGETIQLTGSNGVKMHLENINGLFRLVNSGWTAQIFNIDQSGTVTANQIVLPATSDSINDVQFEGQGFLAAKTNLWALIDSDDNETTNAFHVAQNSSSNSGSVKKIMSVLEDGRVRIMDPNSENSAIVLNKGGDNVTNPTGHSDFNITASAGFAAQDHIYFFIDSNGDTTGTAKFIFKKDGDRDDGIVSRTLMTLDENGALLVKGAVTPNNVFSDIRLKKDVELISDPLGKIDQINGVYFDWIDPEKGTDRQVGVIAQDVEKVMPEVVHNMENNDMGMQGYKYVDYDKLTPLLIESVKELKKENDDLRARIERLEQGR